MQMRYESKYKDKVIEYVRKFAQKEVIEKNFGASDATKANGKDSVKNGDAGKKGTVADNLSETSLGND